MRLERRELVAIDLAEREDLVCAPLDRDRVDEGRQPRDLVVVEPHELLDAGDVLLRPQELGRDVHVVGRSIRGDDPTLGVSHEPTRREERYRLCDVLASDLCPVVALDDLELDGATGENGEHTEDDERHPPVTTLELADLPPLREERHAVAVLSSCRRDASESTRRTVAKMSGATIAVVAAGRTSVMTVSVTV